VIYDVYIKKTIDDLYKYNTNVVHNYEIIVFDKPDKSTLTIYEDVAHYLRNLHKTIDFESLTIIGFSYGGVVASHVMNSITDIECTKKIITYDTPLNVIDNVLSFQKNWLYRLDIMYYNVVYNAYINNYNYNDINHYLQLDALKNRFGIFGGDKMVELIKNVNKCDFEFIHYVTGFRYDLPADIHVINIYCELDPVVNRKINDQYYNTQKDKIQCKISNIKKPCIGHCSDMGFDSVYLVDIINAINM